MQITHGIFSGLCTLFFGLTQQYLDNPELKKSRENRPTMKYVRLIVDIAMSVLMYLLLSSQYTGLWLHELFGIFLIICIVIHQVLNVRWYRALPKGRYGAVRVLFTVADFALIAAMVCVIISGLARGHEILPEHIIPMDTYVATGMHLISGYLAFLLMGFHVGLHLKRMHMIPGLIISALGICAFIHENFLLYITGQTHFVMFHYGQPAVFYFIELLAIWGMMASLAFALKQLFMNGKRRK